jgi:peptidoglycan/xylan/chitin deacetylase (PgdA/CDA1 family)
MEYEYVEFSALKGINLICLTLDLEQDYGDLLVEPRYYGIECIPNVVNFFKKRNLPLTCFVQGSLLETYPNQIDKLSSIDIEFELHSYSHPKPGKGDIALEIEKGKKAFINYFKREPIGYRAPLGVINPFDYTMLASSGFKYDSSIFPSFRPGTFSNLNKPINPYILKKTKIIEFPLTVFSRIIRVPIALSYIELIGKTYVKLLKTSNLPKFIIFNFHLHDLFPLKSASEIQIRDLPLLDRLVLNKLYKSPLDGLDILDEILNIFVNKGYQFSTLGNVYKSAILRNE